jgi:hyperosmotically inducible protein
MLEFARPVREKLLARRMLRESSGKAEMKSTLQRNKPGNPWRLRRIRNTVLLGGLGILIPCTLVFAQAPDNSKTNQQDRGSATADQQAQTQGDRELARKIRKAIIDDKNLSMYAHNVKVIARGGTVTLKGPVSSDEEKTAVESKAVEIAGAANVKDELTVKSKTEK